MAGPYAVAFFAGFLLAGTFVALGVEVGLSLNFCGDRTKGEHFLCFLSRGGSGTWSRFFHTGSRSVACHRVSPGRLAGRNVSLPAVVFAW